MKNKLNDFTGLFLLLMLLVLVINLVWFKPQIFIKNVEIPIEIPDMVKSIACYNLDGSGPLESCGVQVRCYKKPNVNGDYYKTNCPMFIPQSDNNPL